LIKPFDPNTPKDYDGFLRLLSFQSGHKPLTHASTYALEREFPAKLQPDLIDRYLENSRVWHDFALIGDSDVISVDVDCNLNHPSQSYEALGYNPDRLRTPTPDDTVDMLESPSASDRSPNVVNEVEDDDLSAVKSKLDRTSGGDSGTGNRAAQERQTKRKRVTNSASLTIKKIK